MINFKKMMQQAQQMQFKLQEVQEKLADIEVEAEAGGGAVKVIMRCNGHVQNVKISSTVDVNDRDLLEDLIVSALNNANNAKDDRIKDETKKMMAELGMPEGSQFPPM
jgi:DNA-binding YbaB/EbfC family protein